MPGARSGCIHCISRSVVIFTHSYSFSCSPVELYSGLHDIDCKRENQAAKRSFIDSNFLQTRQSPCLRPCSSTGRRAYVYNSHVFHFPTISGRIDVHHPLVWSKVPGLCSGGLWRPERHHGGYLRSQEGHVRWRRLRWRRCRRPWHGKNRSGNGDGRKSDNLVCQRFLLATVGGLTVKWC